MKTSLILTFFLLTALVVIQLPSSAMLQQNRKPRVQQSTNTGEASPEARAKLRKLAAQKKTYKVGYSPAMDRKEAQLSGIEIPKDEPQRALLKRATSVHCRPRGALSSSSAAVSDRAPSAGRSRPRPGCGRWAAASPCAGRRRRGRCPRSRSSRWARSTAPTRPATCCRPA